MEFPGLGTSPGTLRGPRVNGTLLLPKGQISALPTIGHLMYDPRVKRGPAVTQAIQLDKMSKSGGIGKKHTQSGMRGSLRQPDPAAQLASTLKLDPDFFRLHESSKLDVTARQRGPQAHHIRAGVRPRQEIDLALFLQEPTQAKHVTTLPTQTDVMFPAHGLVLDPEPDRRMKSGVDAETQVEHGNAEWHAKGTAGPGTEVLFDFDAKALSLIDHLSSGILGQAETETMHEDALLDLAGRREEMERVLGADALRERLLEEEARWRSAERESAISSAKVRYAEQLGAADKTAARQSAGTMTTAAIGAAFGAARASGGFIDPHAQAVRDGVLPGVLAGVASRLQAGVAASTNAEAIIADALGRAVGIYEAQAAAAAQAEANVNAATGISDPIEGDHPAAGEPGVDGVLETSEGALEPEAASEVPAEG